MRVVRHWYTEVRLWINARIGYGMHTIKTDLAPCCYYDPDDQILYAVMACVDRYIGESEWIHDVEQEIIDIAHWWHIERPANERRYVAMRNSLFGDDRYKITSKPTDNSHLVEFVFPDMDEAWKAEEKEFRALEKQIDENEDEMLIRVMKIRRSMWI